MWPSLLYILMTLAGLLACLAVAHRWFPGRLGEKLAWTFAAFNIVVVLEVLALGTFWKHWTMPLVVLLEAAVFAGVLVLLRRDLAGFFREARQSVKSLCEEARWAVFALAVLIAIAFTIHAVVFTFRAPVPGFDGSNYHLPIAVFTAQHGGIEQFPAGSGHTNEFPKNSHLLFARSILYGCDERALRFFQAIFAVSASLMLYGWMRNWGVSRRVALLVSPLFLALPAVLVQEMMLWGTIDLIFASHLLVAMGTALWLPEDRGMALRRALWAVGAIGLAMGTKGQGLMVAGGITFLLTCNLFLRRPRLEWRRIAIYCVVGPMIVLLLGSTQYVRNYQYYGNPFSPIELKIGDRVVFPGPFESVDRLVQTSDATKTRKRLKALRVSAQALWTSDWIFKEKRTGQWSLAWWLVLLPGTAGCCVALGFQRRWRELALAIGITIIFLRMPGNWWARFSIYSMGFMIVFVAVALDAIKAPPLRRVLLAGTVSLFAVCGAEAAYSIERFVRPGSYTTHSGWFLNGLDTYRENAKLSQYPDRELYLWLREHLQKGDSLVYIHPSNWDVHDYYYFLPDFTNTVARVHKPMSAAETLEELDRYDADYFVVWDSEPAYEWAPQLGKEVYRLGRYVVYER